MRYPFVTSALSLLCTLAAAPTPAIAQHGDGALNRADYEIDARIVDDRTIEATERVRWVHRSDTPATTLEWHLYANAFAQGSLFLRTLSGGAHRGNAPGSGGSITLHALVLDSGEDLLAHAERTFVDADQTRLRTALPRPVARDAELVVTARFTVRLPDAFSRSGCGDRFCFAAQWFPKLAVYERDGRWSTFALHAQSEFYADFGRYALTVDAPASAVVFATGRADGEPAPLSRGRARHRFVHARAHDCAFGWSVRALRASGTARTLETRDGDERAEPRAIRVQAVYTAPDEVLATRAIRLVERAIPALERRYGAYPYDALTIVVAPRDASGIGGMEYPGLVTVDGNPLLPSFVRAIEYVTAHELAHQWFYGVIATDEHDEAALDEGLTEYSTGLVFDELYGEPSLFRMPRVGVSFWAMQRAFSTLESDQGPLIRDSSRFSDFDTYANVVYRRTSALFDIVHREHPAALDRALARYARVQRFRHPTARDLIAELQREPALEAPVRTLIEPTFFARNQVQTRIASVEQLVAAQRASRPGGLSALSARLSTVFAVALRWVGL